MLVKHKHLSNMVGIVTKAQVGEFLEVYWQIRPGNFMISKRNQRRPEFWESVEPLNGNEKGIQ